VILGEKNVGVARFELAVSCSQSRRLNRTGPYPVFEGANVEIFLIEKQKELKK
jgi:hypothetical protein